MTSPDVSENNNIFLGFAQAESSKGSDQAHVILNQLDYYEVVDQMFAICCDTTSSHWCHQCSNKGSGHFHSFDSLPPPYM